MNGTAYDLDFLLHNATLNKQIENLHREGHYLRGACPKCKQGQNRFYTGPKNNYTVFHCQQCGHYEFTTNLLGLGWGVTLAPAVKEYKPSQAPVIGKVLAIRDIYRLFADFAQAQLSSSPDAIEFLAQRGLDWNADHKMVAFIQNAGLGFINARLYRQWFSGLTLAQKFVATDWAGLPDGDKPRFAGHAAMFAGGYQGKIVFPYLNQSGEVVDIRTRSISPKDTIGGKQVRYTSPMGGSADRGIDIPGGVNTIGYARRIVLTEGEFKRLVPMAHGSLPIINLRGTSDWTPDYLQYFRNRVAILAFDNDDKQQGNGLTAGQAATVKHGRLLEANSIAVMVLNPAKLYDTKGIDDYVLKYGGDAFNRLLQPSELITLSEFEAELVRSGADLAKFVNPKADPGTVRQWMPIDLVDNFAHADKPVIGLEDAVTQITEAVATHLNTYRRGHDQLLITAPAGVGKTQTAIAEARKFAAANEQTIAVILPNHNTIDEKINDGTLKDFRHMYGRRWDDDSHANPIQNCEQADLAQVLTIKGFSPGQLLCPECPALSWCEKAGYRSQFKGVTNRAYVHAHAHTGYPGLEDIVILDEFSHKQFIDSIKIWPQDIITARQKAALNQSQDKLLDALIQTFCAPDLTDLDGATFYEVLERFYPGLHNVDAWGDGGLVQLALDTLAETMLSMPADLPYQFGEKLFTVLSEDVRRLNNGQMPTGRIRLVVFSDGQRHIVITYSKGHLPEWYSKRPAIILNATADANTMQDIAGPLKVLAPNVAVAAGNEVIQDVTFNNAKSSYAGNSPDADKRRAAWLDNIRHHITQHPGGEADTTIIGALATEGALRKAFPLAKTAHYGALEGRNDLQAGLTILANSVPINLEAIKREASALYPGIDTTLTRTRTAFDENNAAGEALAIEQVEGIDPRLQALIWQHRDAPAVQAVHRSRIIRQTGRKVVVMFSRPIPGLKPTQVIKDYKVASNRHAQTKQDTIKRLVDAGKDLIADVGGFTVESLAALAEASVNTAKKYWQDVAVALDLNWFDVPVSQTLISGASRLRALRMAIPKSVIEKHRLPVDHDAYQYNLIGIVIYMQPLLPCGWVIDQINLSSLIKSAPPSAEPQPEPQPEPAKQPQNESVERHDLFNDLGAWRRELDLAQKSSDPIKRRAGAKLYGYLSGSPIDKQGLIEVTTELNASLRFKVNWTMVTA
jgi:DNA primase